MELCYAMATGTLPAGRRETNTNPYFFSTKPTLFPNQQSTCSNSNSSSIRFGSLPSICTSAGRNPGPAMSEQKFIHEGLITESLPNGMFRVRLDNQDELLGYVSGRIRKTFIRILPGDRVKLEVSRYDSTKGRITYRFPSRVRDPDAPPNNNNKKNNKKGSKS